MPRYYEVNFDGLVGPTHHYGGYAYGNRASMRHQELVSNPKAAALQGLKKMKLLHDWGLKQGVLPPQQRPSIDTLKKFGFSGSDTAILQQAARFAPKLLHHVYSASSMWAANAATVAPSCDTSDKRLHITVANLQNRFHRSIEWPETLALFRQLFPDPNLFAIHEPIPGGGGMGDEGAANHIRFGKEKGLHLFVYGKKAFEEQHHLFPARQALEASQAVARRNGLSPSQTLFAQQNPLCIQQGAFHNDVISTGHENLFLCHEKAFIETEKVLATLATHGVKTLLVTEKQLPIEKAVQSYLFNSQILTLPGGEQKIVAPEECRGLDLRWLPLDVEFIDLRQSMQNGGGPACLRLRILMTEQEIEKLHPGILLTDSLYFQLVDCIELHYRDRLTIEDLADPAFFSECQKTFQALAQILPHYFMKPMLRY